MNPQLLISATAALAAISLSTSAWGQTKTGQFMVRASVNADCQMTTRDLDFGVYSAAQVSRVNSTLDVKCTPGTAITVSLDGGNSGNPQARTMTGPGSLGYQIYRDSAYQDPINTNGMAFQVSSSENTGQTITFTLYGEVPSSQSVPSGNYTDTVRVTVSY